MATFITGSTGYIGSYITAQLLTDHHDNLNLLIRTKTTELAYQRLWQSLQLHLNWDQFQELIYSRCSIFLGDITEKKLGLEDFPYNKLLTSTESIIHCAASLNRKSAKACFNVNLKGTLEMVQLAKAIDTHHGLRRFSEVSTVAGAGKRNNEVVTEDQAVNWHLSDYDPYGRSKKFCEHMIHELLPHIPKTVFRPSIVLGDSRFAATTQFDMVRAFAALSKVKYLPFQPHWRLDMVPADYVANAIVSIHKKEKPAHGIYHLSSGKESATFKDVSDSLQLSGKKTRYRYCPFLNRPFTGISNYIADQFPKRWHLTQLCTLLKVFLPYLKNNTVFDNSRITNEIGYRPPPFTAHANDLLSFVKKVKFKYPYKAWPIANHHEE
jgi:thioester reductase-like protein